MGMDAITMKIHIAIADYHLKITIMETMIIIMEMTTQRNNVITIKNVKQDKNVSIVHKNISLLNKINAKMVKDVSVKYQQNVIKMSIVIKQKEKDVGSKLKIIGSMIQM